MSKKVKYRDFLKQIESERGIKPTHSQISLILGGKPTANSLNNRYFNDGYLKVDEYTLLTNHFNLSVENSTNSTENKISPNDFFSIPYWEECSKCAERIKKSTITKSIPLSLELILNEWQLEPENLRIISMPGEEMNGSIYPLRNKDILVIDISKTDIVISGVYLLTTNNGEIIAVRRLVESLDGSVSFSVDNDDYAPFINKTMSRDELKQIDFKVIGKVVKNLSYTFKGY